MDSHPPISHNNHQDFNLTDYPSYILHKRLTMLRMWKKVVI